MYACDCQVLRVLNGILGALEAAGNTDITGETGLALAYSVEKFHM